MSGYDNTSYTYRAVSGTSYTVTNQDSVISFSNTGAKTVAILGGSLVQPGRTYTFVNNAATGTATIVPQSGTINGAANYAIVAGAMATIISDGTNWIVSSFSLSPTT